MELKKLEADFRAWLKSHLKQNGCEVTNIESSTKNGIPDVFVQHPNFCCWLELKAYEKPQPPLMRKEQRIWLLRHKMHGGNGAILSFGKCQALVEFYSAEIKEVQYVGNYLRIIDPPILFSHKTGVFEGLKKIFIPTL